MEQIFLVQKREKLGLSENFLKKVLDSPYSFAGLIGLEDAVRDDSKAVVGAIRAAGWLVGKDPGIYDMQDVLGLK